MGKRLQYGIDMLLSKPARLRQQQIALVTNNAAATINSEHSRIALLKNNFQLIKLFSPEHGLHTTGADGEAQPNKKDTLTGLSVISLYNNNLAPTEEDLNDVDVVLFDIPDAGCRFYTYLWTMTHVMEACAQFNKLFIVLDRPNPAGALLENTEGPFLDEVNCSSFIGRWNIPLKHCCTLGELALFFAATRLPNLQIEVVHVKNYQRHHTAVKDFHFTPTSPAIQTIEAAILYPGTGLLEGININEGRGTSNPFEQLGAPWINGNELCTALNKKLKHVVANAVKYKPSTGIYANEWCSGVAFTINNTTTFQAVETGISILQTLMQLYPQQIQERLYKTNANPSGKNHLDKLLGVANAFALLKEEKEIQVQVATEWQQIITPYLLYV
jgi:uncharacterized protein YbbC (DUF1343 family)